ncbi:MAG: 1-(5-phosphoribosyl)-5-[(5-phosphoribosylamino)methylideneamino] imidazole-4-carboxamide isomerase [Acidobacteria bacterium]|nr:MAG: 1-(5-phosphoribosyl)-5-[(5-phosphoribosylamino)methylideneamino] imidazole-4-carboxamide isomerase [Acidobacteriota bacterium]
MIIPCIDLMGRKVVQLVQGKSKAIELPDPFAVLEKFKDYPQIQVIDLDGAMGRDSQADIVRELCRRKPCRVGGGIRSVERALQVDQDGAHKIIVGSSAFTSKGINTEFLRALSGRISREKLMIGVDCFGKRVAIHGWKETLPLAPAEVLPQLEPYCSEFLCTYIDGEGKLQGTDLEYFQSLRAVTSLPITAAGGITTDDEIRALEEMGMNAALGMSIYRKTFPELFGAGRKS